MQDDAPSARTGYWLLVSLLALFAAAKPILFDTLDPDSFWHLRVASQLQHDGIGPLIDNLSYASNKQPWTPYSWLAELGMRFLWTAGGYRLAVAVTAILQGSIILLLAACCLQIQKARPRYLSAAAATAIGTLLVLPYLSFRPVTAAFAILFLIVLLILKNNKSIWLIIPLTVLLTNIHLFSFFVPAICFALALGALYENDRQNLARFSMLSTATLFGCLDTPMIPGLVKSIFDYSTKDKMVTGPVIAEMQSFARGPFGLISAVGVIAMLIVIARNYKLIETGQLICVAVAALLMLKLGRFAPIFALAACPALAATMPSMKDRLLAKPAVAVMLAVVLIAGTARVIISFPSRTMSVSSFVNRNGADTPGYPTAAADFLDRSVPSATGHLINEFSWGGYLAWRLEGRYQVLLDGRTQVYPQSVWQSTYLGSDVERTAYLSNIQADAALIPASKSHFRDSLIKLGWQSAYKDDRAEVLLPPAPPAHFARTE